MALNQLSSLIFWTDSSGIGEPTCPPTMPFGSDGR